MYAATAAFYREITGPHTAITRVDATQGDDTLHLDVVGGQGITLDYDAPTRRGLDVTVTHEEHDAADLEDLLDEFITVLTPYRGVRYSDGTEELIPCGVFFPEKIRLTEDNAGGVTLNTSAFDASTRCQGPLDRPFHIDAGGRPDEVVPQLLGRKMADLQYRLAATPWSLPTLDLRGQVNPWSKASELYETMGYDLAIDRDGICVSDQRTVSVLEDPTWEFVEGINATFAPGSERSVGAEDFPNVVIVKGTNAAAGRTVRGEAADEDPSSRTYRYGRTGERVLEVESEKVTTDEQANAMARLILARELGPQEELTFKALVNPGLDVADVVSITRERLGLLERRMIVTRIQMPLTVEGDGTMQITARRSVLTDGTGTPARV